MPFSSNRRRVVAASTQYDIADPAAIASPSRSSRGLCDPLALWHLLSLDAPCVAVTWTCFVAAANHVRLPAASIAAMAIAVWMLYAVDRLLDARQRNSGLARAGKLEARHLFHHRHRRLFMAAIVSGACGLAGLLLRIPTPDLRLYLIEGCFLSCYLAYVHSARTSESKAPKELAVGLFFAAATFIPTIAQHPELRLRLLAPAMLFSALCSLNGLFIYNWEHPREADRQHGHRIARLAAGRLPWLAVALLLVCLWIGVTFPAAPRRLTAAVLLAVLALLSLHALRRRIPAVTLRAAADAALLTPLLMLPFLQRAG